MNRNPLGGMTSPDKSEKNLAMLAHLLTLLGFFVPTLNILIPLSIWWYKRETSDFVEFHARESLNFQITLLLLACLWGALNMILIGVLLLPLVAVIVVLALIFVVRAAIKASRGGRYQYPYSIRLVS